MTETRNVGNAETGSTDTNPPHSVFPSGGAIGLLPVLPTVIPLAPMTETPAKAGKITMIGTDHGNQVARVPLAASVPSGTILYVKMASGFNDIFVNPTEPDTLDNGGTVTVFESGGLLMASDGVSNWVLILDQYDD